MRRIQRRVLLKGAAATAVGAALVPRLAGIGFADRGAAPSPSSCTTPCGHDFAKVGGNLGNQNYTSLGAIRPGNLKQLGGAWLNRIEGGITTGTNQSTAVAVDGVLYIESAFGNVLAVDGKTGVTKWKYLQTRGSLTRRGVAVGAGKVFTHGRGSWIIALDQATGAVVWERQITGNGNMEKVAVTYHDGLLYVGTHDSARNAAMALDATNGSIAWLFWGTPRSRRARQ